MFKKILALLWLRCKIFFCNKILFLQVLMPFLLTYFYKYLMKTQVEVNNKQALFFLMICLPLSLSLAVGNPIMLILSEEKEKYNLKTLLLSGVKSYEYILSTLFLPFLMVFVIAGIVPFILEVDIISIVDYIIVVLLTSISIILLYLLIGLIAKNQVAAQVISVPVMIIVSFLPILSSLDKTVEKIVEYSLMGLFTEFLKKWEVFSWCKHPIPKLSLIIWIVILSAFVVLTIRKKKIFD